MSKHFPCEKVHTSFIQKLPKNTKLYTKLLAFMPKAFESFDLSSYDLVLCSSSSCAKGVITSPNIPHIAYIHTPMRYAWDLFFDYKKRSGKATKFFMDCWMPKIRLWDFVSSQRIDCLIANSSYIARRIKKFWNKQATVIYPPVNTSRLCPNGKDAEDFYVVFSRFVPYKRVDLAIKACINLNKKLVVIGSGSGEKELKTLSRGKENIVFTGRISDKEVEEYLQRCKALIFCAEEDFGIIPVEAQACGRPVIAFGKGGTLETVINEKTGLFFAEQTEKSVEDAINRFEEISKNNGFDSKIIAEHASNFSEERFIEQMKKIINTTLESFNKSQNKLTV